MREVRRSLRCCDSGSRITEADIERNALDVSAGRCWWLVSPVFRRSSLARGSLDAPEGAPTRIGPLMQGGGWPAGAHVRQPCHGRQGAPRFYLSAPVLPADGSFERPGGLEDAGRELPGRAARAQLAEPFPSA